MRFGGMSVSDGNRCDISIKKKMPFPVVGNFKLLKVGRESRLCHPRSQNMSLHCTLLILYSICLRRSIQRRGILDYIRQLTMQTHTCTSTAYMQFHFSPIKKAPSPDKRIIRMTPMTPHYNFVSRSQGSNFITPIFGFTQHASSIILYR